MALKDNIKIYRRKNGFTLEDVAKHLGISRQTVQKYESGVVSNIPSDKIESMAALFSISPTALMGWPEPHPDSLYPISESEFCQIEKYRLCDGRGREMVDNVLEYEYSRATGAVSENIIPYEQGGIELPVQYETAAAGLGNYLLEDGGFEFIRFNASQVPKKAKFGIRISGDSMEPDFQTGDIVFVEPAPAINSGELGIFKYGGELFFKRLIVDHDKKKLLLRSINPDYADKDIPRDGEFYTYGRVLGKARA